MNFNKVVHIRVNCGQVKFLDKLKKPRSVTIRGLIDEKIAIDEAKKAIKRKKLKLIKKK